MAMSCVTGGRECTGCMRCHDSANPVVYRCSLCGDPIYHGDWAYAISNMHICQSCIDDAMEEALA